MKKPALGWFFYFFVGKEWKVLDMGVRDDIYQGQK